MNERPKTHPKDCPKSSETILQDQVSKAGRGQSPASKANLLRGPSPKHEESQTEEGGATDLFTAMHTVMSQERKRDRGQYEKSCRAWLKKDVKSFMTKLADLEKAHLVTMRRQPKAEEADDESDDDSGSTSFEEYVKATRSPEAKNKGDEDMAGARERLGQLKPPRCGVPQEQYPENVRGVFGMGGGTGAVANDSRSAVRSARDEQTPYSI